MTGKVALIVIYNHRYDKNIEAVEALYKDRFSHIYHLMPFYDGDRPNVIPVYENSIYFQGYVAQGFKSFFNEEYAHYFFVADDLVLNPVVHEANYQEYLNLSTDTSFLPGFVHLHKAGTWKRVSEAYSYNTKKKKVEIQTEIPSYEEALEIFSRYSIELHPVSFDQIHRKKKFFFKNEFRGHIDYWKWRFRRLKHKLKGKKPFHLSYPLVGSYADIFVISASSIKKFCHYCGVFAATDLFVELAIPTALVLCEERIITEEELNLQGQPLWTEEDFKILSKYDYQLKRLISDFPQTHLYLHPIKLSKWK